jgi:hypothetical protein
VVVFDEAHNIGKHAYIHASVCILLFS